MKQKDVIEQLKSLKSIRPNSHTLMSIERDIYYQLKIDKRYSVWERMTCFFKDVFLTFKSNPIASYGIAAALLIIVFLSISTGFLPNEINKTLLYAKIAVAPNQYEKAKIAFSYTQAQTDMLDKNNSKLDTYQLTEVSRTIALANTQLSGLKLMGEKGKYTSQQCQELYKEYSQHLEKLDSLLSKVSIDNGDEESIELLKAQIAGYEKESEQKLKVY